MADLEHKALRAEEDATDKAEKCRALYRAVGVGSEPAAALLKVEPSS